MRSSPFFIVGHERSGTTLMAALLDRHSRVAVPPETHFFSDICSGELAAEKGDPAAMVERACGGGRMRDLGLDAAELLRRVEDARPTWAELFLEAIHLYAERRGKGIVGEKTPNHWRQVGHLLGLFHECRIIWMVRDGRDTVWSLMNMPWRRHSDLLRHAWEWRDTTQRMLVWERKFPQCILRVRFEDLVEQPRETAGAVCQFIGVEFEDRQLDPSVGTGVVPAWEMEWKGRVLEAPDRGRVGIGRREMSGQALERLDWFMGPSLRQLGYEVVTRRRLVSVGAAA